MCVYRPDLNKDFGNRETPQSGADPCAPVKTRQLFCGGTAVFADS